MYKTRLLMGMLALSFLFGMFATAAEATTRTSAPPADWMEFLMTATESQIRYELQHGMDANSHQWIIPLAVVARSNHNVGVVRALLEAGADPNTQINSGTGQTTVLIQAVMHNNITAVRELIEGGAEVNTVIQNTTAVRWAALGSMQRDGSIEAMPEMVMLLLEAGANPTLGRGLRLVTGGFEALYNNLRVRRNLEGTEAFELLRRRYREMSR